MRKRIKATGFSDWDTMFYNNLLSVPVLVVFSFVFENWGSENLARNLCVPPAAAPRTHSRAQQPSGDAEPTPVRDRILRRRSGRHLVHYRLVHPGHEQHDVLVRGPLFSTPRMH
jgi:hypothetical protein